ncbi:MAG: hypothetical protein ACPHCJ_08340 [Oceanococcaceae bacterium]
MDKPPIHGARVLALGLIAALGACSQAAESASSAKEAPSGGVVQVEWIAGQGAQGQCQPQRVARVNVPASELYMIRGKEQYSPTAGGPNTNLPLQIQFGSYDDQGLSEDRATTLVKGDAGCGDVDVRWIISECVYTFESSKGPDCPEIIVQGQEAFASFSLERRDREAR